MQSSGRRPSSRSGDRRPSRGDSPRGPKRIYRARKVCRFCKNSDIKIDYKDAKALRSFITERGKIVPRRISGNCASHQRKVCAAIKRARNVAILPYTATSMHL